MRSRIPVLVLFCGILIVFASGCATDLTTPESEISAFSERFVERNPNRILLDVPCLPQVPPGDWSRTRNCGVASAAMIRAYYFGTMPTKEDIMRADEWLNVRFGVPINGYNGDYTNVFQIRAWLEAEGVPTRIGMGNFEVLQRLLEEGKPVLVAVYSDMSPRGAKHAMVLVGMDGSSVYVHDPGKINGANNRYPVSQFLSVWSLQNNWYLTIE